MDYKEKYNTIIERARTVYNRACNDAGKDLIEYLFDGVEEIKDSEDERIRKEIVKFIKDNTLTYTQSGCEIQKRWIDYLENQKEQKPTEWSEEDSRRIGALSSIIFDYAFHKDALDENNDLTGEYAELDDWLETLPERFNLQPKQEWCEDDETRLKVIKEELERFIMLHQYGTPLSVDDIDWLKSLPERFNLQPKQEWSEEELRIIGDAACALISFSNMVETKEEEEELCELASKLQDLHPQSRWTPIDGQKPVAHENDFASEGGTADDLDLWP